VYSAFDCKTFRDYHDLYLACDAFLLADGFENFRDMSLKHFRLDPCHYYTAPGLGWDAALLKSRVKLGLLTDIDMLLMFEKQSRGGVSMISKRYAQAPADGKGSAIAYYDANNLYGWAMMQPLPRCDFKWEPEPESFTTERVLTMSAKARRGYTLMVDLDYPEELHDAHNAYPLAPESMEVTPDMASPYIHEVCRANKLDLAPCRKLVPNLRDKKNYVLTLANLQLYLRLGMKLRAVHKVISYEQSAWLKSYIEGNTAARQEAKRDGNAFLADFFKLMNNAVFGKTMENVRNRSDIRLWTSTDRFLNRALAHPRIKHVEIINPDLVAIEKATLTVTMRKPIYAGMTILDLSKTLMYERTASCC